MAGRPEDEVRAKLAQVPDPLALLAGFFAQSPTGLQVYDASGRSLLTNAAFRELFGSEPPPGYNVLTDEIAEARGILGMIKRAFAGETVQTPATWYDPRELRQVQVAEGKRVAIEATVFPLRDTQGEVSHVAIVFKDLTAELLAREQAEAGRAAMEEFTAVLGHDLRNPLSAIVMAASLLLRRDDLNDQQRRGVARIAKSADRMTRLVRDLLDLTRARGGALPIERAPADLRAIVEQVASELELAHPGRTIELAATGDARGEWDPDRIAQAASNVIGNALEYSPDASPVRVRVTGSPDAVLLEVTNEGEPIPPEELPHIFEPFRRGNARRTGGLGLGFTIVKKIADAHGATVEVRSTREAGTTVALRWPRR